MTTAEHLAWLYGELGRLGLNAASAGNVSARVPGGMLITPTGARVDTIRAEHIVMMDFSGTHQGPLLPSSEWSMHARIYVQDDTAQVIVHTHSDAATALSCLREGLPAFHYMLAEFGGDDVRCAPYATFGSAELAAAAAAAIVGRSACLLANHGMICHARDPAGALTTAIRLEILARQYLLARSVGTPTLLSPADMIAARARYATYGQQPSGPKP
jgi:L-fuculose-phosphate aldolase